MSLCKNSLKHFMTEHIRIRTYFFIIHINIHRTNPAHFSVDIEYSLINNLVQVCEQLHFQQTQLLIEQSLLIADSCQVDFVVFQFMQTHDLFFHVRSVFDHLIDIFDKVIMVDDSLL